MSNRPVIIQTSAWQALPARGTIQRATPAGVVVHHMAWPNRPLAPNTAAAVQLAHVIARCCQRNHFANAWADTGQHFTITRDGVILEGRHGSLEAVLAGRSVLGAHCADQDRGVFRNADIGIECEGTYSSEEMPAPQWQSLVALLAWVCERCQLDSASITDHRSTGCNTACPGDRLHARLGELRKAVHDALVDARKPKAATTGTSYLRLTQGQASNAQGLLLMRLAWWKDGTEADHVTVVSGQPGHQVLRLAAESPARSFEPIPEGEYLLGDADAVRGINWASGKVDDYSGSHGDGLGPVWVGIHPAAGNTSRREALGIHLDANEQFSPGTAGCIGVQGLARLQRLVGWFGADWPQRLQVDWGLGSVQR